MEGVVEFEAFKNSYFMGAKTITHEMLDFCKKQYENVILKIQNDDFFEPYDKNTYKDIPILANYILRLNALLGVDTIKTNQIGILIRPSFEAESLLILEKQETNYKLTYKIFEKSYWLSSKNGDDNVLKIFYSNLSKEIGDTFAQLIDKTMNEAQINTSNFVTLDGNDYSLIRFIDGQLRKVHKNPTNELSKSYKIARFIDDLNSILVLNPNEINDVHLQKWLVELM